MVDPSAAKKAMFDILNKERVKRGFPVLHHCPVLEKLAEVRLHTVVEYYKKTGKLSHAGFEFDTHGFNLRSAEKNLQVFSPTITLVVVPVISLYYDVNSLAAKIYDQFYNRINMFEPYWHYGATRATLIWS